MSEIEHLYRIIDAAAGTAEEDGSAARAIVAEQSAAVVTYMAEEWVATMIRQRRRSWALRVERRAHPMRGTAQYRQWVANTEEGKADQRQHDEAAEKVHQMLQAQIRQAVDVYADELRMQWTAELLNSNFALGDGTVVTWGEATIAQHEARRDLFLANAQANAEGAARHIAAIDKLRNASCDTLNQLFQQAA